jgi:hypothetical protein
MSYTGYIGYKGYKFTKVRIRRGAEDSRALAGLRFWKVRIQADRSRRSAFAFGGIDATVSGLFERMNL